MNKSKLKDYAPRAREAFIKVVSERAALYGITAKAIEPCEIKGDYAFISGKPFPKSIEQPRKKLMQQIEAKSYTQVMEEAAYTWFNRFAAIRFMEVNGYLSHGYRVLSHPESLSEPEILEKAQYLEKLDGLEKDEIIELKTAGDKDAELYRKLIIAQCNELHSAMPFLFEKVDDPTELLLPDNLLNTDSVTRQLVTEIPEEDWKQVEIIGWLYQFYISEKKDKLMKAKKAYKTEDIPAVTQLFTPNWIVKYLVQNSLGEKWLATYPSSKLKEKMEYYIEPAEQTEEVTAQLKAMTPESLNPEELTVMDPACGSGHILVEAYDLLKEIYLERGYRPKDIPSLIITKNLFGLEIDERAAQLSGFALMMKARADDSRIFSKEHIEPNVVCIQETADLDREGLLRNINTPLTDKSVSASSGEMDFMDEISTPLFAQAGKGANVLTKDEKLTITDLIELLELFENAKTFGSLIRMPQEIIEKLPRIKERLKLAMASGDLMARQSTELLTPYFRQAVLLGRQYDCVIANPPYMGSKAFNEELKDFINLHYPASKSDLYACFITRNLNFAKERGFVAMITIPNWMFLTSYSNLRNSLLSSQTLLSLVDNGRGVWGSDFGSCEFIFQNCPSNGFVGSFKRLFSKPGEVNSNEILEKRFNQHNTFPVIRVDSLEFRKVPDAPITFWISSQLRRAFSLFPPLGADAKKGLTTGDNDRFVRYWYEVAFSKTSLGLGGKWFPMTKGGDYRKWYGNLVHVVNWENDGYEIRNFKDHKGKLRSRPQNVSYYFREGVMWNDVSMSYFSARYVPRGVLFNAVGPMVFGENVAYKCAMLNSIVNRRITNFLCPTMKFEVGSISNIPMSDKIDPNTEMIADAAIDIARKDWDSYEISWKFSIQPLLKHEIKCGGLSASWQNWLSYSADCVNRLKDLEEKNNRYFINTYCLQDELAPDVPIRDLTLFCNPVYRYKGELSDDEVDARFRADTIREFISYAVGCIMGRYSLDKPGLIYANSSNEGFDQCQYKTFPADDDGIIPITDREWFDDDAAVRFFKFIETVWDQSGLDANLDFIAEAIGRKANESSREAIRRYLSDSFFKDHCQTYKKRPIYWLFTSGKQKAFQALVYLHRYNEGTLSRMRTEYVLPLQTKMNRRLEHLDKDKDGASSTSTANKIQKEITLLQKQKEELIKFDELLRHYADMKIKLDLDDGVKVNYEKFGDLLAKI